MMERSLFSARHCFVENLHDTGKMCDAEYSVLCEWFDFLASGGASKVDIGVDLIVYLRTSPEVAYERKKARARKEEEVSKNYTQREIPENVFARLGGPMEIIVYTISVFADCSASVYKRIAPLA